MWRIASCQKCKHSPRSRISRIRELNCCLELYNHASFIHSFRPPTFTMASIPFPSSLQLVRYVSNPDAQVHSCQYCSKRSFEFDQQGRLRLAFTYDEAAIGFNNDCQFFQWCFPRWTKGLRPKKKPAKRRYLRLVIERHSRSVVEVQKHNPDAFGLYTQRLICYTSEGGIVSNVRDGS